MRDGWARLFLALRRFFFLLRIRVIGVHFSEFLSQEKGNLILSQRGIRSIRVRVNRVKMKEK